MIGFPIGRLGSGLREKIPFFARGQRGRGSLSCGLSAIRLACSRAAIAAFFSTLLSSFLGSSISAAHLKRGFLDALAQRVQMLERFFGGRVAKDYGKLFASSAEGSTTPAATG